MLVLPALTDLDRVEDLAPIDASGRPSPHRLPQRLSLDTGCSDRAASVVQDASLNRARIVVHEAERSELHVSSRALTSQRWRVAERQAAVQRDNPTLAAQAINLALARAQYDAVIRGVFPVRGSCVGARVH